jgi:hypothetical protein
MLSKEKLKDKLNYGITYEAFSDAYCLTGCKKKAFEVCKIMQRVNKLNQLQHEKEGTAIFRDGIRSY